MKDISIKIKIMLWTTVLMLLMVGVLLGFMISSSEYIMEVNSESQLIQVVDDNFWEIEIDDGELEIADINFYTKQVTTLIYDETGQLLYGQIPSKLEAELEEPEEDYELEKIVVDNVEYYVYDRLFSMKPFPVIWMRGVTEVSTDSDAVNIIFFIAIIIIPFVLLLAAIGSYFIAKRALLPIEKIIDTAHSIQSSGDLSLRINLGQGGDEVHRLAQTFDELFVQVDDSFQMEKQFSSDVSHELRTPTAIILAQCDMEECETKEDYRESVEIIKRQASKMSALISSLLNLTRMDRGLEKGAFDTIDISELIYMVCEELEVIAPNNIKLLSEIEPNIFMDIDQGLFMRMISNLINNGFTYGIENGYVKVVLKQTPNGIVLMIEDNGIGIAKEHQSKIWNRFYQVDRARTGKKETSMGLGLAMVEQIVKMHGGAIQVVGELGKGSSFQILFKN